MSTYELHERVCVPYGLIAERRHPRSCHPDRCREPRRPTNRTVHSRHVAQPQTRELYRTGTGCLAVSGVLKLMPEPTGTGSTTIALPPPRRTGSATAWSRPPGRNAIPVAAPISAVGEKRCPCTAASAAASGEAIATTGWPSARTIVGLMLLRGRLPPASEFADPGWKLKSVSSLLSRNP